MKGNCKSGRDTKVPIQSKGILGAQDTNVTIQSKREVCQVSKILA